MIQIFKTLFMIEPYLLLPKEVQSNFDPRKFYNGRRGNFPRLTRLEWDDRGCIDEFYINQAEIYYQIGQGTYEEAGMSDRWYENPKFDPETDQPHMRMLSMEEYNTDSNRPKEINCHVQEFDQIFQDVADKRLVSVKNTKEFPENLIKIRKFIKKFNALKKFGQLTLKPELAAMWMVKGYEKRFEVGDIFQFPCSFKSFRDSEINSSLQIGSQGAEITGTDLEILMATKQDEYRV